jgi:hypothetical protein
MICPFSWVGVGSVPCTVDDYTPTMSSFYFLVLINALRTEVFQKLVPIMIIDM